MPEPFSMTVWLVVTTITTTINQAVAAFNSRGVRKTQEKLAADTRALQSEAQKQAIQSQIELAAKNHTYRLAEAAEGKKHKIEELDYLQNHKNWPLKNPPDQTRCFVNSMGFQTLTVFVAPLAISQNQAGGTIPAQLIEKQQALDWSLREFLDNNYHRSSKRPVYYMDGAWPLDSQISGESAVVSLLHWLRDLPILVLQPCAVGKEIAEIRFWFWDFGIQKPDYGSFRLSNMRGKTPAFVSENPEALSRIYHFLVATVADWRLLAQSGLTPYFPTVCRAWKESLTENENDFVSNALDCAIAGYEKVIVGIAKNDLDKALRICGEMKSIFEEFDLKSGVARLDDCIRKISPARPKKNIGNIKDYVSQFGT